MSARSGTPSFPLNDVTDNRGIPMRNLQTGSAAIGPEGNPDRVRRVAAQG
jgi:hypothetical protein